MSELTPLASFHIAGGLASIVAGPLALLAPKGRWLHRKAGAVFFYAMLAMAGFALVAAVWRVQKLNIAAAGLTLYLVATAWSIVRARPGTLGRTERWAPWAGAAVAAYALIVAVLTALLPGRLYDGDSNAGSPAPFVIMGLIALLAVGADLWTLRRGGLAGPARVSRHLWRMCVALFIAMGSFSVQLPLILKRIDMAAPPSLATFGPALAVLVLMGFWLVKVRLGRRADPAPVAA